MKTEQEVGFIYIVTNLINGKQDVGQTIRTLKERMKEHEKDGYLLSRAIKKYGFENFKVISFSCPEEDLNWTEGFLQKELNTVAPYGYNLIFNENQHRHFHKSSRQKMSETRIKLELSKGENNPMFGDHRFAGENHPMWGKHHSEEARQKQSENHADVSGENNPMFGNHRFAGENHPQARNVILISPEGIEYQLPCYTPFCKEHNLNSGNISQVLQGKQKHHKGWTGKYV